MLKKRKRARMALLAQVLGAVICAAAVSARAASPVQTQADMNEQSGAQYRAADRQLNEVYAALLIESSPGGQARLRTAQRAWTRWRDAQCAFETTSTSPYSARPLVLAGCLEKLTREQTQRLDAQRHCAEGDIGCGHH